MKKQSFSRSILKGKSMSSIQPYQQSRVTNKSNDTKKVNSKISKVSKANSSVKIHHPLSLQNHANPKQSKTSNSINKQLSSVQQSRNKQLDSVQQTRNNQSSSVQQSRKKIQSHLQKKQSFNDNPVSFRPSNIKDTFSKSKQNQNFNGNNNKSQNQKLMRQNKQLKQKYYRMQQTSLQDKQKIKNLITRISQIKRQKQNENSAGGMVSKSKTTASYAQIMRMRGLTERQNAQTIDHQNKISHNKIQTPFRILQPGSSTSHSKYSRFQQSCGNPQCQQRRKYLQNQLYRQRIRRDELQQQKRQWQRNREQLKRQYKELLSEIQNLRQDGECEQ